MHVCPSLRKAEPRRHCWALARAGTHTLDQREHSIPWCWSQPDQGSRALSWWSSVFSGQILFNILLFSRSSILKCLLLKTLEWTTIFVRKDWSQMHNRNEWKTVQPDCFQNNFLVHQGPMFLCLVKCQDYWMGVIKITLMHLWGIC